jgi:hypothetical protein
MAFRLFRNRSLTVGLLVTFIYMATFGALPYFLTVLMQSVHGYRAPCRPGSPFSSPPSPSPPVPSSASASLPGSASAARC